MILKNEKINGNRQPVCFYGTNEFGLSWRCRTNASIWCSQRFRHDDVIKWKKFPRYWPFVRGIHRSPVNSPHKGQWRGALMFTLICARINRWINNRGAGDLRRYRTHYDVIVMDVVHYSCVIKTNAVGQYGSGITISSRKTVTNTSRAIEYHDQHGKLNCDKNEIGIIPATYRDD